MNNLKLFTLFISLWGIISGLVGPFYTVHIANLSGGAERLGLAFSIMILMQAITSYLVGHYSDRLGRKPFLFATAYMNAAILLFYTIISEPYQIYILQALLGVTNAVSMTIRESLLGDLTVRERRGRDVGRFNAAVGVFSAAGLALGGYMTKYYGLKSVFYFGAAVMVCSTLLLFPLREPGAETQRLDKD